MPTARAVLFVTHDLEEAIALGGPRRDHVGGPLARAIIGELGACRFPRPRDISEVRMEGGIFHALHRENLERAQGRG